MSDVYEEMLKWTPSEKAGYIRGFVDGEGWPAFYYDRVTRGHHKRGYISNRAVFISNTNKKLLLTIQKLLEMLGVKSRLYLDAKAGTRRNTKDSWKVAILGQENLTRFSNTIGFGDADKMQILQNMLSSYRKHGS